MRTNPEGLTWAEWAYAAGIPEPPAHGIGYPVPRWDPLTQTVYYPPLCREEHGVPGYAHLFRKERKAWNRGEDPSEWRARKH